MIEGLENVCKADSARSTKIDCTKTIEEYIQAQDWRIKANANTGYSNAGLINNISGKIIANYWLDKVYSKAEGDAHRNGDYYIHDLDCLAPYCFTKDTKIKTLEYGNISIEELISKNITSFTVVSYDNEEKKAVLKKANNLHLTRKDAKLIEITFADNLKVRCTPDHKFLTTNGWIEAINLTSDDEIITV